MGQFDDFNILLVDNDRDLLSVLADAIGSTTQNKIKTASNGEEAMTIANDWVPHIIMLDLNLPDKPGIKLLEEINSDPMLSNASVILMAEQIDREMRIIAFSYGAYDFLQKPIEILELLQKIQNLLSIKKATLKFQMLNKQLQREKSIMMKFFSEDIVEQILNEEIKPDLGGDTIPASVLFFDIRNSTGIAESITPQQFSDLLSLLFTDLMDLVYGYDGSVNKLLGDGLLVTFGAPVSTNEDAIRAVRCALKIRKYLETFNDIKPSYLKQKLEAGVGIATGKVFAGNIGSKRRMEYTVLGDPVNIASRLESLTKLASVDNLIDGETYNQVKHLFKGKRVRFEKIRGKIQEVKIYTVTEELQPESEMQTSVTTETEVIVDPGK